jgi:hypothetical protein
MANTVPILNFTNTFGDLLSQQNRAAVELNTLGANNYTKDSGTLILNGAGTGLSVTGAAILGSTIVANTASLIGDVTALANVFINGAGFALDVANNANIRKNTITDTLLANTIVRTTTVNASGNVFANDITSNNSIRAVSIVASGNTTVNALRSNTSILGASLNITGQALTNALQANTSVESSTLIVSNLGTVNSLQSNTTVNTAIVTATNTIIGNNIQANTGLSSSTLSVSGGTFVNTILANTSIAVPLITITSKLDANSAPTSFFNNLQATGQLSVGGDFIINGTTVYSTNTFTINANSTVGQISSFNVNRGSSGANASIRWNETQDYWDINDVNNPSSFSKILTANLISDSLTSISTDTFASSLAANTLDVKIVTANTSLKSYVDNLQSIDNSRIQSIETINLNQNNAITIIQGVDATQNTRLGSIETVDNAQNSAITIIQGVDATQNTRLNAIETINTNQNTSITIIQGVDATQNTRLNAIETINTNQNTSITAVNQYAASAYGLANTINSTAAFTAGATFTGPIQAPTASSGTSNTQVATTAFVNNLANSGTTFAHSITGNAGSVTNGVYTSGDQTISGTKTFNSTITGSVSGSAATVTNSTQSSITTLSNLTTVGTITSGTWSGSFGAVSGANLTSLNASNLGSGTVPSARLTGTYAISISGNAATATNGGVTSVAVNGSTNTGAVTIRGLGLGGEVWNNVTGSRALGTTYTNNFGYPIMISVYGSGSGSSDTQIYVNGVLTYRHNAQWNGAGAIPGGALIIPNGATYSVSLSSGLSRWSELY